MQAENDLFDESDRIVKNYLRQVEEPGSPWRRKIDEIKSDVVTVMLIPHDHFRTYSIRVPKIALFALAFILLATVSTSVFFVVDYNNIQIESSRLAHLRETDQGQENEIIALDREIRKLREDMDRLRDTDVKLRTIADMALLDESLLRPEGGGNGTLLTNVAGSISQMEHEVSLREESYRELTEAAKNDNGLFVNAPAIRPITEGWMWQRYGKRKSPFTGQPEIHEGITFVARKDTPVLAAGNGRVEKAFWDSKYGNQVLIDHGYGYKSFYGHMSKILIRPGQTVKRGSPIGYVGNTGRLAEGVGLFYQILVNRKPVNPEDYFPAE